MEDNTQSSLPKRVVRTITLTQEDLSLLDGIEREDVTDRLRIKTDSKLIMQLFKSLMHLLKVKRTMLWKLLKKL